MKGPTEEPLIASHCRVITVGHFFDGSNSIAVTADVLADGMSYIVYGQSSIGRLPQTMMALHPRISALEQSHQSKPYTVQLLSASAVAISTISCQLCEAVSQLDLKRQYYETYQERNDLSKICVP